MFPDFRFDLHKIDYPRRTVTKLPDWSHILVQNTMSQGCSFNQFAITLQEYIQNSKQFQMIFQDDKSASFTTIRRQDFSTNPAQYARNRQQFFNRHGSNCSVDSSRFKNRFRCPGTEMSVTSVELRTGVRGVVFVQELFVLTLEMD